jgi:hypothetical protein
LGRDKDGDAKDNHYGQPSRVFQESYPVQNNMSRHCGFRAEKIWTESLINEWPSVSCYEVSSNRMGETLCHRRQSAPRWAQSGYNKCCTRSDAPQLRVWLRQLSLFSFAGLGIEIGVLLLISGNDGGRVIRLVPAAFTRAGQDQLAAGFVL